MFGALCNNNARCDSCYLSPSDYMTIQIDTKTGIVSHHCTLEEKIISYNVLKIYDLSMFIPHTRKTQVKCLKRYPACNLVL